MKKILFAWMLLCTPAMADESKLVLRDAPGRSVVAANCSTCHSLDYIPMNSVFLERKGWEAVVNKMIKVMNAPIKDDDVGKIVDYLAGQYGK